MSQPTLPNTAAQLHELFKEDWEWSLREHPETATYFGETRYNHLLTDLSPETIERQKTHQREMLTRIAAIDRNQIAGQDAISYDLFLLDKQLEVESQQFPVELIQLTQMDGPQIGLGQLVASMPFETADDYEHLIARLEALPVHLDQAMALMRRGMAQGWTPPAVPLRSVPAQIAGQIVSDPAQSWFFESFKRFPAGISNDLQAKLRAHGESVIGGKAIPALRKLAGFVKDVYLPACREEIGAGSLTNGAAYYRYAVRRQTTADLPPEEIHEIGKREVGRILGEMKALIKTVEYPGSFHDFLTFLRTDPQFYYTNPHDLIVGYAAISKRMDGELPKLFAELPRTPYGVREIPEYEALAQTTGYYLPGAADGSRAGYFYVNTYKLETRPKYEMEALSLHEAVPGHHLQIARAQELKGLPDFRRNSGYTGYVEGWGLYAESLGSDIGFYSDAYSKFGQLTYEMWRACRLVVDTGIHQLGWTRQQAIDYMLENTAKTENDVTVEVDRYIVWPAQALAYKIGELKIKELRARAQARLGSRFDLRRFHNAILDDGALPLNVLDKQIDLWISRQ